jgi:hypothetical protein
MARVCLFCGARAGSREHLWPDWLNNVLPDYTDTTYTLGGQRGTQSWSSKKPATHKIGAVCTDCNTGWLSRLETAAKPLLTPLITGHKQRLNAEAELIIAAWAFKIAILGEYLDPSSAVIDREARRWLFDHGEPAAETYVYLGATDARWPGDTHYSDKKMALHPIAGAVSEGLVGNVSTILIKHLALQVGWSPLNGAKFMYQAPFDGSLAQIWPILAGSVQWPPGLVLQPPIVGQLIDYWRGDLPPNPPF